MSFMNAPRREQRFSEHVFVPSTEPDHCSRCNGWSDNPEDFVKIPKGSITLAFCASCILDLYESVRP